MQRVNTYPERLSDADKRKHAHVQLTLDTTLTILQHNNQELDNARNSNSEFQQALELEYEISTAFREHNQARTQQMADSGMESSQNFIIHRANRCAEIFYRWLEYILERSEEDRMLDQTIQARSYAGFFYFIKWLLRSLFLALFAVAANIAGKELGCEIKSHTKCQDSAILLWGSSPHVIASLIGMLCGIVIGQWMGRIVWDKTIDSTRRCLRVLERLEDRCKSYLVVFSISLSVVCSVVIAGVFYQYVNIFSTKQYDALLGGAGCLLGCSFIAGWLYIKGSPCISGQHTPFESGNIRIENPPELVL